MNLKPSTIEAIESSRNIQTSFLKYGDKYKISITYYDGEYVYTLEAWARISFSKSVRLNFWDDIVTILKPKDLTAERIDKTTGESKLNNNQDNIRPVFNALCSELTKRGDGKVYLEQYLNHRKAS